MASVAFISVVTLPITVGVLAAVVRNAPLRVYWSLLAAFVGGLAVVLTVGATGDHSSSIPEFILEVAGPVALAFSTVRTLGARRRPLWAATIGAATLVIAVFVGFTLGVRLGVLDK